MLDILNYDGACRDCDDRDEDGGGGLLSINGQATYQMTALGHPIHLVGFRRYKRFLLQHHNYHHRHRRRPQKYAFVQHHFYDDQPPRSRIDLFFVL